MNDTSRLGKCKPWRHRITHRGGVACHCEQGGSANLSGHKLSPTLSNTAVNSDHLHACVLRHFSRVWLLATLSLPASPVHGILQGRRLEWVAMPPSWDLPDPGIEPVSLGLLNWQACFLPLVAPGKPLIIYIVKYFRKLFWWGIKGNFIMDF